MDAKAPTHSVLDEKNIKQAYAYATHIDVHCGKYALCNGVEFALFHTTEPMMPMLHFPLADIDKKWLMLCDFLSYKSICKRREYVPVGIAMPRKKKDYENCQLLAEIPVRKRACRRHFGVHGYFTRQAWNVVQAYIKNFSDEGDTVLDPYGGTGITAIEALLLGRRAINIDINPMSVFMVEALLAPVDEDELQAAFEAVRSEYIKREPKTDAAIERILKSSKLPPDLPLPKGSDVATLHQLFTPLQMAQLALLRAIIKKQKKKNENIWKTLMLMFSGIVGRANITWYPMQGKYGAGPTIFTYYRYRKAPKPATLDIAEYFEIRYKKVLTAKQEIEHICKYDLQMRVDQMMEEARIYKGTATKLTGIHDESVDYIYTDPPYGEKIKYLDLSVMWNAWLDLEVSEEDYKLEAIEDGSHNHTKGDYRYLIRKSIDEMYRVLRYDRWLSFVFAHKDPEYWYLVVEAAESAGFEYRGTVSQPNGHISYKKIQNPHTTLSGELIINFFKSKTPKIPATLSTRNIRGVILQSIDGVIAKNNGATREEIHNAIIQNALNARLLHLVQKENPFINKLFTTRYRFDDNIKRWMLRDDIEMSVAVPMALRIQLYLHNYMYQKEFENITPSLEEIIASVMPNLKNGTTPDRETVIAVLRTMAEPLGDGGWRLIREDRTLFD
jgi:16S rRNA G966 N2-methylase RsmD